MKSLVELGLEYEKGALLLKERINHINKFRPRASYEERVHLDRRISLLYAEYYNLKRISVKLKRYYFRGDYCE